MLASSDVLAGGRPGAILVSTACAGGADGDLLRTIIDRYENVKWSQSLSVTYLPPELVYRETYTPDVVARLNTLTANALAACPADESDLYRRRVLWLKEGFAEFFKQADLAR